MSFEQTPPDSQEPAVSPWGAVIRVLISPAATFESIRERAPIAPGYVTQMLLGIVMAVIAMPILSRLAEEMATKPGAPPGMGTIMGAGMGVMLFFTALAGPWLAGLFVALIALIIGAMQGGEGKFGQYFAMIGYARIPVVIGGIVIALMQTQAHSLADAQKVQISLAALLPASASPVMRNLAATINPFDIWYYALLAVGFAAINRTRVSKGAWLPIALFSLMVLMAFATGGLASFGQSMQPPK